MKAERERSVGAIAWTSVSRLPVMVMVTCTGPHRMSSLGPTMVREAAPGLDEGEEVGAASGWVDEDVVADEQLSSRRYCPDYLTQDCQNHRSQSRNHRYD